MPTFWSAASENDGIDGHALVTLPQGVDDGALTSRGTKAGVGVGTGSGISCEHKERGGQR